MKTLLRHSIYNAWKHKATVTIIYVFTVLLSLILGITVFKGMHVDIGNSMALEEMTNGFNRTVFVDWMDKNKATIVSITDSAKIALISFILWSFFLNTALLSNIVKQEFGVGRFIKNGIQYFFPFIGITFIGLVIISLSLAIIYIPYIHFIGNPLEDNKTEVPFIYSLIGMGLLTTLLCVKVWAWATFSKAHYVTSQSIWNSIKLGAVSLKQQIWKVLFVGLILLLVGLFMWYLIIQLNSSHSAGSWIMLILVFVSSQLLVWLRVFVKTFGYGVIDGLRAN